jgi:type 2 lantibiotic biosynthesis protein LanM
MIAEALIERTGSRPAPRCPLPLPEYLTGYGLAQSLIAAAPLIEEARDRVRRGAADLANSYPDVPFDPANAESALAGHLTVPFLQMISQVVVLELHVARLEGVLAGDTPEERFASFVDRLRDPEVAGQLFKEYPVLAEQVAIRLQQWSAFSLEFLTHLCEDWKLIRPLFSNSAPGRLAGIQGGAGDTHRNGRAVMIASFTGGERLVYKPRSLAPDLHFQHLLGWLNDRGARPGFRQIKLVDRGNHGWAEFIPTVPCATQSELSRFYERQGGYLATLYAIRACDFFCENLIAAGEHPILIDLEALFHPRLDQTRPQGSDEIAGSSMYSSVLATGLLPMRIWAANDHSGVDISGLGNSAGQLSPKPVPQWERPNTDEMRLVRRRVEMDGSHNCPTLQGQPVNAADYAASIAAGFDFTYRLLLAHRSELLAMVRRFCSDDVRVIVRPTRIYGALLHESFHPDVLRDDDGRAALFDRLRDVPFQHPSLEELLAAERRDLLRGDIPIFTTQPESRDLWTSDNRAVKDFFAASGMSLAEQRILGLSDRDLERQLWTIRASLATLTPHGYRPGMRNPKPRLAPGTELGPQQFLTVAAEIGDRLAELAFTEDDRATWLGIVTGAEDNCHVVPLGPDLYEGLPGIILFLAYLGEVSADPRYCELAKAALRTLRRQLELSGAPGKLGAFSGWGGVIYLLAHLGTIWGDPSLFAEAEALCDRLLPAIEPDRSLDLIGGASGCVLALLALFQCRPRPATLETARRCGEHLLRTAQPMDSGIGWLCGENAKRVLTGFAHGNAGIGYALAALGKATGDSRFEQAAAGAFAYERSLYSPEQGNWPDLRNPEQTTFATAWCHGAPGIALSRLRARCHLKDPLFDEEIDAGLAATARQRLCGNHALCHGDLGNADILLEASVTLQDPGWRAHAVQTANAVMANAVETGWLCANPLGVESPGLLTGLAGIGYAFLRFAGLARVPSVLALDGPVLR